MTSAEDLAIVLAAARQRAADLERLAAQPFTLLSAQTPHRQVEGFTAKRRAEAAAIRDAADRLDK